jgi:GNAT superfamily N-acetyltransferase
LSWEKLEKKDLGLLEDFLIKNEIECVTSSAWLKEKIISQAHLRKDFTIFINKNKNHLVGAGSIHDAVMITEYGMICPIIKNDIRRQPHRLLALSHFINQAPVIPTSILGLKENVEIIERLLVNRGVKTRVDYYLMALSKAEFKGANTAAPPDIKIRKARISDAEILFDIQKQYELEEVCLNPYLFDDDSSFALLKNNLRKEIIYFAQSNGTPIAKAGTNARGYNVYQIGGVFTQRNYRRMGLAHLLMLELLKHIFRLNKTACLFVKKINKPAVMLYRKLGFTIIADFRITYI